MRSGAGVILAAAVQDAFKRGLSGLEFAVGIPGTVGGAIAMNAGSRDEWIGSIVETVTLFVDRCVMCTRCVRFTREISGTASICVNGIPGSPVVGATKYPTC